jgi:hypothetical protein
VARAIAGHHRLRPQARPPGAASARPRQDTCADRDWGPARRPAATAKVPGLLPSGQRPPGSLMAGRGEPSGHPRDGHGASAGPHLVPAIPTTGLAWSGGIIPVVRINGASSVLFSPQTGIGQIHTKRWDGQNDWSDSSHSAAWSQKNMSYQSDRTNGSYQSGERNDMTS